VTVEDQLKSYDFALTTMDQHPETKPVLTDDIATWPFCRAEWGGPCGTPTEPCADWSPHVWADLVDSSNGVFLDGHVSSANRSQYKRQIWRDHEGHANDWDSWYFW